MSRYQFPSAGTATTDASLLVSGTLSDARLSSNVALENVANVFTAKQSFSGVDHVGLCLNSLTTAEYTALTATNGDLYRDSTTDRIDARLARGTVELIDTAGGQAIAGNLAVTTLMVGGASGPLLRNNAGVVETRSNDNSAYSGFACLAIQAGGNITCSSSNPTTILSSTSSDTNAVFQVSANGTSRGYYGRIGGNVGLFTGAGSAVLTHDTSSNITCAANLTASGIILTPNGTVSAPTHAFSSQPTSGFYLAATSYVGLTTAGIARWVAGPSSAGTNLNVLECIGMSVNPNTTEASVSIGRTSTAGLAQIGSGGNNASGSLQLTNLTAIGTITYSSIVFPELVTNGGFDTDTAWTKGTGWTISGGTAVATGVTGFADIQQNLPGIELGRTYVVTFTVTVTSGQIAVFIGASGAALDDVAKNNITQSGTHTYLFTKNQVSSIRTLVFRAVSTFTGTIDNVSVKRAF